MKLPHVCKPKTYFTLQKSLSQCFELCIEFVTVPLLFLIQVISKSWQFYMIFNSNFNNFYASLYLSVYIAVNYFINHLMIMLCRLKPVILDQWLRRLFCNICNDDTLERVWWNCRFVQTTLSHLMTLVISMALSFDWLIHP